MIPATNCSPLFDNQFDHLENVTDYNISNRWQDANGKNCGWFKIKHPQYPSPELHV
jgi:hypothetical protein